MALENDLEIEGMAKRDMSRYAPLGLLANPFTPLDGTSDAGTGCEIASQGNRLLSAIVSKAGEETPKPLLVRKRELPSSYHLQAVSHVETSLAQDDSLNILYGYVQLFMMKIGAVRATLGTFAERLAFRDFELTLVNYLDKVLAAPDTELVSYQVLGSEGLDSFRQSYEQDPVSAVRWLFGDEAIERQPELAETADLRALSLDDDVDENDSSDEIDTTMGDAPGTLALAEVDEQEEAAKAVLDYVVEYTKHHVSPVMARGLRVYHDRGMAALAGELKVTKAPRKTLTKLTEFAAVRYRKVVFIYDAFENWLQVAQDVRSKVVGSLSSLRWATANTALLVFLLGVDEAPEVEETFGGATVLEWDFPNLEQLQADRDSLVPEIVDYWLASSALPGAAHITMGDPVLSQIAELSGGSLRAFLTRAEAAVEKAAEMGATALNDAALEAARAISVE